MKTPDFYSVSRADADTVQARENHSTQRDAAVASGARYIVTDDAVPDAEFSDYHVDIPGGGVARCNPVAPGECTEDLAVE